MWLSPVSCYFFVLGPDILFSTLFSDILYLCSSFRVIGQVSHPRKSQYTKLPFINYDIKNKRKGEQILYQSLIV
jgi:hypothetical protein